MFQVDNTEHQPTFCSLQFVQARFREEGGLTSAMTMTTSHKREQCLYIQDNTQWNIYHAYLHSCVDWIRPDFKSLYTTSNPVLGIDMNKHAENKIMGLSDSPLHISAITCLHIQCTLYRDLVQRRVMPYTDFYKCFLKKSETSP